MNTEDSKCKQEIKDPEEGSESVEQGPQKQLKRGKCGWLDAERDTGSVEVKVSGLKQCLHVGKVFPFHTESEVSREAQLDANRTAQQLIRSTDIPESRQACLQQDAASNQSSRPSGK